MNRDKMAVAGVFGIAGLMIAAQIAFLGFICWAIYTLVTYWTSK